MAKKMKSKPKAKARPKAKAKARPKAKAKAKARPKKVQPIPAGRESVTPYLCVSGGAAAIDWYTKAFGAKEVDRMAGDDGKVMHAEMLIGKARIMLADEFPEMGFYSPRHYGGAPVNLLIYFNDVDEVFARAIAEGATEKRPVETQFYGDRTGTLVDPFGHVWSLATRLENLTNAEIEKRAAATFGGGDGAC